MESSWPLQAFIGIDWPQTVYVYVANHITNLSECFCVITLGEYWNENIGTCVNTSVGVTNVISILLLTTCADAPTIQVTAVQVMLAMLSFIIS